MKTTAVLLAAVTLSCAVGAGASPLARAEASTPTTRAATPPAADGPVAGGTTPTAADVVGTTAAGTGDATSPVPVRVSRYRLSTGTWTAAGPAPTITLRLDADQATSARVQVRVEDPASHRIVLRQTFGVVPTGVDVQRPVTDRLRAMPGRWRMRLIVRDRAGDRRERTRSLTIAGTGATIPAAGTGITATATTAAKGGYVFPVQGACNFRTLRSQRFHASRDGGRLHNGQDIGTYSAFPPVVAMTSAVVSQVFYDVGGGGWTLIMNGDDGTAYGYLHLKAGSIVVSPGQRLTPGQRVANAGNTGGDYDPHLHVEMRPIPWAQNRDRAVDPFPLLSSLPNPCDG